VDSAIGRTRAFALDRRWPRDPSSWRMCWIFMTPRIVGYAA